MKQRQVTLSQRRGCHDRGGWCPEQKGGLLLLGGFQENCTLPHVGDPGGPQTQAGGSPRMAQTLTLALTTTCTFDVGI